MKQGGSVSLVYWHNIVISYANIYPKKGNMQYIVLNLLKFNNSVRFEF